MKVADGALRYGILYDLAGRKLQRDPREASVERMMNAFHADKEQAKRVGDIAVNLLKTMSPSCFRRQCKVPEMGG